MKNQLATQDYIKSIATLLLSQGRAVVKLKSVSEKLGVSNAAASDMVKKLVKGAYVKNHPYKGIELTSKGWSLGRRLIRHHRLWEVFLNRTLNIPWDKVHNEAEHLEHAASDALMNRMDEYLGFPTVDPHGNPIPGLDGTIFFDDNEMVLSEICDNFLVVIHRLEGMDATVLSYLSQQGLCIGSELRIIQRFEFDKTFICEISGRSIQLSFGMAQHIYVLPSTDTMN